MEMLSLFCSSVVKHSSYMFNSGFIQDVDYEATMAAKLSLARKIFAREKDSILSSSSFQKYLSENEVLKFFPFLTNLLSSGETEALHNFESLILLPIVANVLILISL